MISLKIQKNKLKCIYNQNHSINYRFQKMKNYLKNFNKILKIKIILKLKIMKKI